MIEPAFFESPKEAVESLRKLVVAENWKELARHYDLSGTDFSLEELHSGAFFVRTERPEISHPGEFWRIRRPFHPAFSYLMALPTDDPDIVTIRVGISIDQGSGSPMQEGWTEFRMRKSGRGFQMLPD